MAGSRWPVRLCRRDDELASTAHLHAGDSVLPTWDQPPKRKLDRLAPVPRAVEFLAGVVLDSDVMHLDVAAGHRLCTVAHDDVLHDHLDGRGAVRKSDYGFLIAYASHGDHRSRADWAGG